MFDAQQLLQTQINAELSTQGIPIPEGEYVGAVEKLAVRQVKINGEDRVVLDVVWGINDPSVKLVTNRDKNSVKQGVFLDLTSQGGIDYSKGMNVELGRLREAVGQNRAETSWSPQMLLGQAARVLITHWSGQDGQPQAQVKKVTKI